MSCATPHYWEAYARGSLRSSTTTVDIDAVQADPNVRAACTASALSRYLGGRPASGHLREVLPPRETDFALGKRGFVCLAAVDGAGEVTGSLRG